MKALSTLMAILVLTASLYADGFKKGEKVAQIGLGYGHAGIYGDTGFPPVSLGFQYGFEDKISVGGILGYSSSSQDFYWGEWSYTYIMIGARGEYHFLEDTKNIDAYAGVTIGYDIVSSSWTDKSGWGLNDNYSASGSYALFGAHVGAKYYFTPQISLFGELGYGVSYISAGIAYKF
ncbi:MAG: outer membrane beta-barrel protein [archaeon]